MEVRHWNADVNGISLHVAERGPADGPAVLLHGFLELWLSWRHQMVALAARGFRALAPDLRGYGDSSAPTDPTAYSIFNIVALLDHLRLPKVLPFLSFSLSFLLLGEGFPGWWRWRCRYSWLATTGARWWRGT
jgi:pimeloyl-ACP methyl ester carboxylesterase